MHRGTTGNEKRSAGGDWQPRSFAGAGLSMNSNGVCVPAFKDIKDSNDQEGPLFCHFEPAIDED